MVNWKTGLGGFLLALGQIAEAAPIPAEFHWIPGVVAAIGGAFLGATAKDYDVHSTADEVRKATAEAQ